MRKILILILLPFFSYSQFSYKGYEYDIKKILSDQLKFSTVYGAINGGTSISDVKTFSIIDGLQTSIIETPYDYSLTIGIRKIEPSKLIMITDLLGRPTKETKNQLLFYLYNDGTVEKKLIQQ